MVIGKKGSSLVPETIVVWALVIAGILLVGLALYSMFEFSGESPTEVCRLSVLTRATVPADVQPYMPLKCSTKKICFTEGESCKEFNGEKNVMTVKLKGSAREKAQIIEEETANAMFDCWSIMGQGKLDISGSHAESIGLPNDGKMCVICSRLALGEISKDVLEMGIGKGNLDVAKYMETHTVPGTGLSYLQAMSEKGINSYLNIDSIENKAALNKWANEHRTIKNPDSKKEEEIVLNTGQGNEIAFLFSQIKTTSYAEAFTNLGRDVAVVAGGTFMIPGVSTVAKKIILTPQGLAVAGIAAAGTAIYIGNNVYQGRALASGYCGEFTSTDKSQLKGGCSLVSAVPYTIDNINSLCDYIEGTP